MCVSYSHLVPAIGWKIFGLMLTLRIADNVNHMLPLQQKVIQSVCKWSLLKSRGLMQSIYKLKCESLDCSFQIWHLRNKEKNGHPLKIFKQCCCYWCWFHPHWCNYVACNLNLRLRGLLVVKEIWSFIKKESS